MRCVAAPDRSRKLKIEKVHVFGLVASGTAAESDLFVEMHISTSKVVPEDIIIDQGGRW